MPGTDQDDDLFRQAMGKVRPMSPSDKIVSTKAKPAAQDALVSSRSIQAGGSAVRAGVASLPSPQPAEDPWVLIADGISRERLKRLAAGSPAVQQTFDLHGISRNEALKLLDAGFQNALNHGQRALCIIHGRGLHSRGKPVIKAAVYHWLRDGAYAHAVLAAIPRPGSGGGACLVLLRRK